MVGQFFNKITRQAAIATAQKKARTLIADGYKFAPVSAGFYFVYRPDNLDKPAFELQLYRDLSIEKMTYECSCPFYQTYGMCEHGDGLILHLQGEIKIVHCAEAAPERGHAFRVVGEQLPGHGPMRIGGEVFRPVYGFWEEDQFWLGTHLEDRQ